MHHAVKGDIPSITAHPPSGAAVYKLEGLAMRNYDGLFAEFARKLSFPEYFGHNWPALEDCLYDMTWGPSASCYLLVINDWPAVLSESELDRPVFTRILSDVGASWAQYPGTPIAFNSLLVGEELRG
ncbi:barstar family protein [Streptomyces lunaelactis]|nr:barstar family protein [Streptomyces lunaelactis]